MALHATLPEAQGNLFPLRRFFSQKTDSMKKLMLLYTGNTVFICSTLYVVKCPVCIYNVGGRFTPCIQKSVLKAHRKLVSYIEKEIKTILSGHLPQRPGGAC